ncbi:MAG: DNA primase [Acidobacteria bacterium]|nr:DNA primase [Acidobacteriota bacterium]
MPKDFREFVNEVSARASIIRIISDYSKPRKQGSRYVALCPFHKEKTPSFSINPEKNLYHCFGCGVGGNIFNFVMDIEKVEFKDAVKIVAERCGIPIPSFKSAPKEKESTYDLLYELNEAAAAWFFQNLLNHDNAYGYLNNRGIDEKVVKSYRLGYAPDNWEGLISHIGKRNYDKKILEKSGLFLVTKNGELKDLFRGRIMFPIHDYRGRIVGFGGRTITDDNIKYLNSPETPIFHKSRNLFGLDRAITPMKDEDNVILVEGYFDQILLWQHGFHNAVAPLGTAFNEQAAGILKRYTSKATVSFDSDEAGQKAAVRALQPLLSLGFEAFFIKLPSGMDPDDYIRKHGAASYKDLLNNSLPMFEFLYEKATEGKNLENPREKAEVINSIAETIKGVQDVTERDIYLRKLAERMNVSMNVILQKTRDRTAIRQTRNQKVNPIKLPFDESKVIRILSDGNICFEKELEEIIEEGLVFELTGKAIHWALARKEKENVSGFIEGLESDTERTIISRILVEDFEYKDSPERELIDCIHSIRKRYLLKLQESGKKELSEAVKAKDEETATKILKKIQDLACQIEKLS